MACVMGSKMASFQYVDPNWLELILCHDARPRIDMERWHGNAFVTF